jgi:hypothetical protein
MVPAAKIIFLFPVCFNLFLKTETVLNIVLGTTSNKPISIGKTPIIKEVAKARPF